MQGFVRLVAAVVALVAHKVVVDALFVGAGELAVEAGVVLGRAVRLVRVVATVVLSVTPGDKTLTLISTNRISALE